MVATRMIDLPRIHLATPHGYILIFSGFLIVGICDEARRAIVE
jgi:hypothetical protein